LVGTCLTVHLCCSLCVASILLWKLFEAESCPRVGLLLLCVDFS
jgi:hypothetical protein